jgi:hypothetical protein
MTDRFVTVGDDLALPDYLKVVPGNLPSAVALRLAAGLDRANNTTDAEKPVSTATQTALDGKVSQDGTPRLMKLAGDTRAGVLDWEFNAGIAGYLMHLRAGVDSISDEYALGIGLDGGAGGGILISQKTASGIGLNLSQVPGTGVGLLASNRSSIPIINTEIYVGGGGMLFSLKEGQGRADGVLTFGSPTLTSATANFTSADVGRTVQTTQPKPNDLPAGTTIVSVESATSVTLSKNATATRTGVRFMILGRPQVDTQKIITVLDTDSTSELFTLRRGSLTMPIPVTPRDAGSSVLRVQGAVGQVADLQSWRDSNTNRLSRVNKNGYLMTSRSATPPVADLDIGEGTFHFDPTQSVEKLKVSLRNGAGNLVTREIELNEANGTVLKSPNGTRYRLTVGDDGALTTTAL